MPRSILGACVSYRNPLLCNLDAAAIAQCRHGEGAKVSDVPEGQFEGFLCRAAFLWRMSRLIEELGERPKSPQ